MNAFRLTWRSTPPPGMLDAAPLRPDRVGELSLADVVRMRLSAGRTWYELGELFVVEQLAVADEPRLELPGHPYYLRLAAGMQRGELIVEGHAGTLPLAGMAGGRAELRGDTGDMTAAAMSGGRLVVTGTVGAQLAGPLPGTLAGMQGGEIVVFGGTGPQVGLRQRRGLIAVAGDLGPYAGHHMRAGTIVAAGRMPVSPGIGMHRGTIVCLGKAEPRPPLSFGLDGSTWPLFWHLLARRLRAVGFSPRLLEHTGKFLSYSGDRLALGRGELLYAVA